MEQPKHLARPVVDPDLPSDVRDALLSRPDLLTPASGEPPPDTGGARRPVVEALPTVPMAVSCAALPVVCLPFMVGRDRGLVLGGLLQLGLAGLWWGRGFWPFMLAEVVLEVAFLAWLLVSAGVRTDPAHLARVHHGRYYVDRDFTVRPRRQLTTPPRRLMRRAQEAVAAVQRSAVGRAGLLYDMVHPVDLPRVEWGIAETLAEHSARERRLAEILHRRGNSAEARAELEPHWQKLRADVDVVVGQVEALERYADRVRAADAVYREQRPPSDAPPVRLARPVSGDSDGSDGSDGSHGSDGPPEPVSLEDSLQEARRAARALPGRPVT
ncbi:hypothetical protein DZF91_33190 [Actinomadura logoneensis]|uniref:Uncharacterized protein n=1 Tax=Actinomadura logoneensis TaxID=2293572 RepID=A0A372JC29_9ACTN|nr:hypothetical protein [Actinomadura logoneensis]RFU37376.1 hypothetical protein DZF91_33190 [Actinomadura logoneensis]